MGEESKLSGDKKYVKLEGMGVYPLAPPTEDGGIEWVLRYGSEQEIIDNKLYLASIVYAYNNLINMTNDRRNKVCNKLKNVLGRNEQ